MPDTDIQDNQTRPVVESETEAQSEAVEDYVDPLADDEDLQKALMDILSEFDRIEENNRISNVRIWKKCENYWHHIQNMYWSVDANDWRSPETFFKNNPEENFSNFDMKIVNIYRAHGESIVAALSVNTPSIKFFPDDADQTNDVLTAKACSKISKMIERQNKGKLLLMRMIYILFNQGLIAVHNYSHESEEYGVTERDIKKKKTVHSVDQHCSNCGELLQNIPVADAKEAKSYPAQPVVCPACDNEVTPINTPSENEVEYVAGSELKPKIRQKIDVYGPLNVKVSSFAYNQRSVGILVLDSETDYAKAQEMYPNIADKFRTGILNSETSTEARRPNNVYDSYQTNNVTVRKMWLRPWMFNKAAKDGNPHEDVTVQKLKKLFPHGCLVHAVNTTYAESYHENLDTSWSLSFNPLSRYIHGDPIGMSLLPIQDMTNEMVNLELQSIEYGIPETFVDPEVLDLDAYKQAKGGPGMVFPVKSAIPGQPIGNGFYQQKTATLTDEAGRLRSRLDSDGQFVSGDYPSIYGGPNSGDTAAEYSMSRQQALQRLSITWTIINFLWADVMKASVNGYISNLKEDEHYVEQSANNGDFVNIWIKKEETNGNIGDVYPEASEQFPMSWAQQREVLMQLMQQQNPLVDAVLGDPNNRSTIAELLGFDNLTIPGDQARKKQLAEITDLAISDPEGMPGQEISSVMPEEIDDHPVHIETCKYWMNSDVGQYFKKEKPAKYANVMLHMQQHMQMMSMGAMQQNETPPGESQPTDSNTQVQQ